MNKSLNFKDWIEAITNQQGPEVKDTVLQAVKTAQSSTNPNAGAQAAASALKQAQNNVVHDPTTDTRDVVDIAQATDKLKENPKMKRKMKGMKKK